MKNPPSHTPSTPRPSKIVKPRKKTAQNGDKTHGAFTCLRGLGGGCPSLLLALVYLGLSSASSALEAAGGGFSEVLFGVRERSAPHPKRRYVLAAKWLCGSIYSTRRWRWQCREMSSLFFIYFFFSSTKVAVSVKVFGGGCFFFVLIFLEFSVLFQLCGLSLYESFLK